MAFNGEPIEGKPEKITEMRQIPSSPLRFNLFLTRLSPDGDLLYLSHNGSSLSAPFLSLVGKNGAEDRHSKFYGIRVNLGTGQSFHNFLGRC